jgi:putative ATP-binding cassette transporter
LAIARVLLKKPRWVFADEATSALDEATEKKVYEQLLALVNTGGGALFSIALRPAVASFHGTRWVLQPQAAGTAARYKLVEQAA